MDSLPSIETQDIAPSSSPSTRPKNHFKEWAANGYRVIPVIPGGAETVPGCDPGKTPGHIHKGGKWGPLKGWRTIEPTPELLEKWHRQGANIGLPRGDAFMIDIDAYEEAQADRIEALALEMLGPAPCRVGSWPKRALLYRADGDVSMVPKVLFASAGGTNGKGQVEIPAQVVVQGRHAAGHEYTWPRKPKPLDKLTTVTHADLVVFMDAVAKEMPDADFSGGAAPKGAVDQHLLAAPDLAHFERAVKALPNTTASAPDYDSMIKVMYAIDAGCGDDKALSNELVHHWCAKWHDYDQEITESRWQRMQGVEKRVGARFVYQMVAEHVSDPGVSWEDAWLEDLPPDPEEEARKAEESARFTFLPFQEVAFAPILPTNEPLIKGLLDLGAMSVMYGDSNVGKTFVAMDLAFHVAAGLPYANMKTSRGLVVYVAAEGGNGAKKRIVALKEKFPEQAHDADFLLLPSSVNLRQADADLAPLAAAIRGIGRPVHLLVLDTLSRVMAGGDENSSVDMGALVKNLDWLRSKCAPAHLMTVHHTGKDRAKGARGHSLLRAATDTEIEVSEGEISVTKQRDLDKAWESAFRLKVHTLGLDADDDPITSCTVQLLSVAEGVGLTPDVSRAVLEAMDAAWQAGEPWSLEPRAKDRFAVRFMCRDHGFKARQAEEVLNTWRGLGLIRVDIYDGRSKKKGLRVTDFPGQAVPNLGVFE